ncbi:MAG: SLC13 family permease, partial [Sciscionella sp.]
MCPPVAQETVAILLLLATLVFALTRPKGLPEAVVAVPAASLALLLGLVNPPSAWREVAHLLPTLGFLAAILVLAFLADAEGVFRWVGGALAATSGGSPRRLLLFTFGSAAVTTAVLSLDATVVLLTPVVFATVAGLRLPARPHVYACTHLANSASTLLPVSNLTNLLAFGATGLSFAAFTGLMALPWLVVIGVEFVVFLRFFATDLCEQATARPRAGVAPPVFALVVLALVLLGFGIGSAFAVAPAWIAAGGALVLLVRSALRREVGARAVVDAASPLFLLFVAALSVLVAAVSAHG